MRKYIFVDKHGNQYGEEIQAKSKLEACKIISKIYWIGNRPHAITANFKTIHPIIKLKWKTT